MGQEQLLDEKQDPKVLSYSELLAQGRERMVSLKQSIEQAKQYGWSDKIRHAMENLEKELDQELNK